MPMEMGTRLGPYEVLAKLGEGGMGEVYRARDTRLDRSVALKVSKEAFSDRFEREARAVAALNHPNICTLHDVGPNYLVMELVDGVPLAGPLPVEKAVDYAGQILDALEAAHRQGITHRDLKPANILVTKQGIKLLDFGLATKASPTGASGGDDATVAALTQQGQIAGTLQYMAPEQLQGQPADARSDIFAFGCVLYELLSGTRAFDGSSQASVIAAILERDPTPLQQHPPLDRVIATCLAKDPDARFQNARDVKHNLHWAMEPVAGAPGAPDQFAWWQRPIVVAGLGLTTLIAVMLVAAGSLAAGIFGPAPAPAPVLATRFELPADPASQPVWADDGRQLAWLERASEDGPRRIVLRRLDEFQTRVLDVGEGEPRALAFSPDGEWLAYTHVPAGAQAIITAIRKVRTVGGPSEQIAAVPAGETASVRELVWHREHVYLTRGGELLRVPAAGGTLRTVLSLPGDQRFMADIQIINDGRDLLFVGSPLPTALWTVPMSGGAPRRVLDGVMSFRVTPTGHLLRTKGVETQLLAHRFREDTIEVQGDAVPLFELSFLGYGAIRLSPNGMLASVVRDRSAREPVWVDRATGRVDPVHADLPSVFAYQLSPDGQFLLYQDSSTGTGRTLRAWEIARQRGFVVTDDGGIFQIAAKTQAILFQRFSIDGASRTDRFFRVDFPWTSAPVQVAERPYHSLEGVSPDGQRLLLRNIGSGESSLVSTDGSGAPVAVEPRASFSPDGRWLAYIGRPPWTDLWVRPEPAVANTRWLVSGDAGWTFWSGDSREIFYRDAKQQWYSVTIRGARADAPFELGRPVALKVPADVTLLDSAPDGTRFLGTRELSSAPPKIAIVQNFFEELRAKVPVK
jgi:predicted Ser/Thr protein kinase